MFFKDFKKDAYGYLTVDLIGRPGSVIEWAVGEVSDGFRINRNPGGYRMFRSGTITLREGITHCRISFPKHVPPWENPKSIRSPLDWEIAPFRYAEINGDCIVSRIQRHEIFPENFSDDDSFFESSNENLNRIWEFCKYSVKATAAFGIFIDGERERRPYEGDSYINQLGWFSCCADPEIPRRTIDFLTENSTWPTEWRLLMPMIVRDFWMYTGDRTSADRWIERLPEKLLKPLCGTDNLLRGNRKIHDIIDWPECERDDYEFGEVDFVPNAYLVRSLESMYELTGETDYLARAEAVRKELRKQMFRNGLPVDHSGSSHTSLHSAVFSLWANLCTETEPPLKVITEKGMACSVYAAQFLLEVCFSHGLHEYGLNLLTSESNRSWNNMLRKGATITMEAWDDSIKPNQDWNHAWGTAPANIIPHFLCGLRPVKPGFEEFICRPAELPLNWKLKHPTPHGHILAEYVKGKLSCREVKRQLF